MKWKFNNKYVCWGVTLFLVVASGLIFYYLLFHGAKFTGSIAKAISILSPIVVGMVIAYLLCPVLNYIEGKILTPLCNKIKWKATEKRFKIIRAIGILLTAFIFVFIIYFLSYMMISQIVPSIQSIYKDFDTYVSNITAWVNKLLEDNPEKSAYIVSILNKYSDELEKWVKNFLTNSPDMIKKLSMGVIGILGSLWNFIIGFIISIYMLASKEKFSAQAKKLTYALFEKDSANKILYSFRFTNDMFIGFLGGKIVDSIIIGLLCFIGTTIMQTPYAALVSIIIGVTNIIPFFGPYLGAIPSAILILMVDITHPLNCLYFVIFILILQQFDGNILGPKILGSSTGLTGFWVIFSITLFGGIMGVLGLIIGVPLFGVIYAAIKAIVNIKLERRGLPTASESYGNVAYIDETGIHTKEEVKALKEAQNETTSDTQAKDVSSDNKE